MVRPGDKIEGRYEVLAQLAVGGMGTLWRARHVELEVDVALKVILPELSSPTLLKRFKREAQAAARLRSPNIVRVLDYGVFEEQPYLAMELLSGEDLAARLKRESKLAPEATLTILEGIAQGLTVAHDAGVVHRDLKPANVFLERVAEREVVKILDFGVAKDLAKEADPIGTTGTGAVGSPAYMSPEQVWGEPVGPPADLWALAALAFEMLTAKAPFVDETLAKVFERIIRAPLPSTRDFAPELPPSVDAVFARAFARSPGERFGSARELVEALRQALSGGQPLSPAATPKSLWLAVGLVAAIALGALLLGRHAGSTPAVASASASAEPAPVALGVAAVGEANRAAPGTVAPSASVAPAAIDSARRRAPSAAAPRSSAPAAGPPAVDPQFGIPLRH